MNDRSSPGSRSRGYASADAYEHTIPPNVVAGRRPATPPPGRSRSSLQLLPLALGTVAGIVLVIVGVTLFAHRSEAPRSPSVAPTAHQICADLTTQQYGDLYGQLSRTQQTVGTSDQFAASQRQIDAQLGTAHTCTFSVVSQDASGATITLSLTRGSSPVASAQVRLTLEQNAWRIADYDSSQVTIPLWHAA